MGGGSILQVDFCKLATGGRKLHAEESNSLIRQKCEKKHGNWLKYGPLGYWHVFWMTSAWRHQVGSRSGDVSMTSSGDVAVCEQSTGIAQVANTSERWRAGVLTGRRVEVTWAGVALAWAGGIVER